MCDCRLPRLDQGYECFYLGDCSAPVEALEAAMSIMEEYTEKGVSELELEGARGAMCYSLCDSMDDVVLDALTRITEGKDVYMSKMALKELATVTKEEVESCIRDELSRVFEVELTCGVMTCPEDKVEEYDEELKEMGYETVILSFGELIQQGF